MNIPVVYADSVSTEAINTQHQVLWGKASPSNTSRYMLTTDNLLSGISVPWDVIKNHCVSNDLCKAHIQQFYDDITQCFVSASLQSKRCINMSYRKKAVPAVHKK